MITVETGGAKGEKGMRRSSGLSVRETPVAADLRQVGLICCVVGTEALEMLLVSGMKVVGSNICSARRFSLLFTKSARDGLESRPDALGEAVRELK